MRDLVGKRLGFFRQFGPYAYGGAIIAETTRRRFRHSGQNHVSLTAP
jgi:hypothetical protein